MAIDREVVIRVEPRRDGKVVARSDAADGVVQLPAGGVTDPRLVEPSWGRTIAAVLGLVEQPDRAPVGFDAEVSSSVPVGSGLSSSAAFAVAMTIAASNAGSLDISPGSIARIARASEQAATGVRAAPVSRDALARIRWDGSGVELGDRNHERFLSDELIGVP